MQDAVIIGGGPAGSYTGFQIAKQGFSTTIFEEHENIGLPSHCAGHISIRSLKDLGLYPLPPGIVENVFSAANFHSPKGSVFKVQLSKPVTCVVNRTLFDRFLADKARSAGAEIISNRKVQSLLLKKGKLRGLKVGTKQTEPQEVAARIVVDAEGISSRILRQTGLKALDGEKLVYAVEAEVENAKDFEENTVEVYLGKDYAAGFYGWLIPRLDGTAKVGLATRKGNPKTFLDRLFQKHPTASIQLRNAKTKHMSFHSITLGGLIPKAYNECFLAVGDCASQVKPTTGGGVVFSITCAKIAAEVAAQGLRSGDLSENFLKLYQKRVKNAIGFDIKVMLNARKEFDSYSDSKIDKAIRFANKFGLNKALRDIDEIDFQGRMILSMLKKPAAYAASAYILALHLLKNA
jgi:digeranylgeranylglycerophospholipid reductase